MGDVIVIGVLALIVAFVIRAMWKERKAGCGCSGCSGSCGGCSAGCADKNKTERI